MFGIWICIALHCACALPLFVRSVAKMSRQTTLGRFGFEKSISHRTSVMETKVTDLILFQLCQGQLSVIMKLYCIWAIPHER